MSIRKSKVFAVAAAACVLGDAGRLWVFHVWERD